MCLFGLKNFEPYRHIEYYNVYINFQKNELECKKKFLHQWQENPQFHHPKNSFQRTIQYPELNPV